MPTNPFDDAWEDEPKNPFDSALDDEPGFVERMLRAFGGSLPRALELPVLGSPLVSLPLAAYRGELPGLAVRHAVEEAAKRVESQTPGGTTMERVGEQIAGGLAPAAVNTGLQALGGPLAAGAAGGYQAGLSAYEQARAAGEGPLSAGLGAVSEAAVGAVAAPLAGASALGKFAPQGAGLIRQLLTSGGVDALTGAGQTAATLGREALQGQEVQNPVRQILESGASNAGIGIAARGATRALEPRSPVEAPPVQPEIRMPQEVMVPREVTESVSQAVTPEVMPSVINKGVQAGQQTGVGGLAPPPAAGLADKYVNVSKFKITDPAGEGRLRETVERVVVNENLDPKRIVSWGETKAVADSLGLSDVSKSEAARMTGPELLAIRNITSSNIDEMVKTARELDNPDLGDAERLVLEKKMGALDSQNYGLLDRFIKARSQKGRDLNNLKIVANLSSDPVLWNAKAAQWAGMERLTPELKVRIADMAAAGDREGYYQLVSGLKKSTVRQRVMGAWKAGLVSNPLTHAVNVLSTDANLAAEYGKDYPGAIMDALMSTATGKRTLKAPSIEQAKALGRGFKAGVPEAKRILKGQPSEDALARFDFKAPVEYGNSAGGKLMAAYVNGVFRALGAEDRLPRTAAFWRSLQGEAELAGISFDEAAQRVDMVSRAVSDSEHATFQNATGVGRGLQEFARHFPLGELIVPFQRTPGAVATKVAEYSPVGLAVGAAKSGNVILKAMRGADVSPGEQRYAAQLFGRGMTGSALVGLGMYLRARGIASPVQDREDKTGKELGLAGGVPGSAVKIGDYWLEIGRLSPVGNMVAVGATLWDILNTEASFSEKASAAAGAAVKSVTDQPFLAGPRDFAEAAGNPVQRSAKVVEGLAGSVVPAVVAGVARGIDPKLREIRGVEAGVKSRIPKAAETLPTRLDVLGRDIPRGSLGVNLFNALLNPTRATKERLDDPVIGELFRLKIKPTVPKDEITIQRKKIKLNQEQYHDYREMVGKEIYIALEKLFANNLYQKIDEERQVKRIQEVIDQARDKGELRFKKSILGKK